MRKPITQKAKSPLKQTSAGDVLMESKSKTPDVTVKGTKGTPEEKRTILYSDLSPEQRKAARAYNMKKFGTHNPTAEGLADNTVVTKAATPGTPDKVIPGETKTESYAPKIKREGDAITPWENRWNRRVEKANRRWDKQDAKRELRAEAKQDARDVRQAGGSWAEGYKARRDLMTGRGELSDSEKDLYDRSRGLGNDEGTYASEQRRTLASGDDKVTVYEDLEIKDAGTSEGERTLGTYGRTIGGDPKYDGKKTETVEEESMAKMRYSQNVGFKAKTPLKKGYFK